MKNSMLGVAIASIIASGSAFSGGMMSSQQAMMPDLQWGVSILYDELVGNMAIGLGAQNDSFEFGIDGSIDDNKNNASISWTEYYLGGHVGVRRALLGNMFGSVGVAGNYGWLSGNWTGAGLINENPYTVGPYVGLEYQPNRNVQFFARVMPYSREKNTANLSENEYFQEGKVGITYFCS